MSDYLTDAELDELLRKAKAATPGEWQVYDSCSWRRIGLRDDYRVIIEPYNSRSDHHPDLTGPNIIDDLAHVSAANPETIQRLIAEVKELRARGRK